MAGSATCSDEGGMMPMKEDILKNGTTNVFNQDMDLIRIMHN